jgi:hypothetical protein
MTQDEDNGSANAYTEEKGKKKRKRGGRKSKAAEEEAARQSCYCGDIIAPTLGANTKVQELDDDDTLENFDDGVDTCQNTANVSAEDLIVKKPRTEETDKAAFDASDIKKAASILNKENKLIAGRKLKKDIKVNKTPDSAKQRKRKANDVVHVAAKRGKTKST